LETVSSYSGGEVRKVFFVQLYSTLHSEETTPRIIMLGLVEKVSFVENVL